MVMHISGQYGDIEAELTRIENLMDVGHQGGRHHLELVLDLGFEETQNLVHIITHSLKTSGRADSTINRRTWEGVISYGGPSPGRLNDPVTYARHEMGRGQDHDWFRTLDQLHPLYEEAVSNILAGRP